MTHRVKVCAIDISANFSLCAGVRIERLIGSKLKAETQIIAFGAGAGRVLVCVYTWRGTDDDPMRWIISPRPANRGERHAHRTTFPQ